MSSGMMNFIDKVVDPAMQLASLVVLSVLVRRLGALAAAIDGVVGKARK